MTSWPTSWLPVDCVSVEKGYLWSSSRTYITIDTADQGGTLYTSDGGCTDDGTGYRSEFPCYLSTNECRKKWYHVPTEGSSSVEPFFGDCAGAHSYSALYRLTFKNPGNALVQDIEHISS